MKKILFVIDMQNDFIDGSLGTKEAVEIVPRVKEKIESYKKYIKEGILKAVDTTEPYEYPFSNPIVNNDSLDAVISSIGKIIYTKDTHSDSKYLDTLEGKKLPIKHCIDGTPGWAISSSIFNGTPNLIERVITKNTFGASVRDITQQLGYFSEGDEIEIVGLCTDICVLSNAIILRALYPDTKIIVDSSCCAGTSVEAHRNALEAMKMCQIDVI